MTRLIPERRHWRSCESKIEPAMGEIDWNTSSFSIRVTRIRGFLVWTVHVVTTLMRNEKTSILPQLMA